MKCLSILLFLNLAFSNPTETLNFNGTWVSSGDNFENKLILEKIEDKQNRYRFVFYGWRTSYDSFTKQDIKFSGEMNDEIFIIDIKNNKANYSDDGRQFEEGWNLYRKGEERCRVYFEFCRNSIKVETNSCSMIYGGFGVSFDGQYKKIN